MIGIDTYVPVRFLVQDDKKQAESAHAFLSRSRSQGEVVYVSAMVLCETAWVLRSVFGRSRTEILPGISGSRRCSSGRGQILPRRQRGFR